MSRLPTAQRGRSCDRVASEAHCDWTPHNCKQGLLSKSGRMSFKGLWFNRASAVASSFLEPSETGVTDVASVTPGSHPETTSPIGLV